jgi:hypothetical protein
LVGLALSATLLVASCGKQNDDAMNANVPDSTIAELQADVNAYAPVKVDADISHLTDRQKQLIAKLAEAGKICDKIFWSQSCKDGAAIRDSLAKLTDEKSKLQLQLVDIYYGPYNKMKEYKRFVGTGAERRPDCGGFYPDDMTKEEFEKYIADHPEDKEAFTSAYTVIVRDSANGLKAIPYSEYYGEDIKQLAQLTDEAAELCDNPSLKKYLKLRAEAYRTNKYFESDWAWMDLKDNDIDIVMGPIESYEDGLFNYKTSFEAVVMVKDEQGTKDLDMFKENIDNFQKHLPWDKKFFVSPKADGTVLQMVNVTYFGGDCNKATKTIAAALPNDPNVYEKKGGKKSMYKNLMEAKFDKILVPIAKVLLDPSLQEFISKPHMVSFVTLHEVSHNLGRGFVFGQDKLTVRDAMKEKYSPIEELKADICSMHNHKILQDLGKYTSDDIKKAMVTYVAGLFRSMRFGSESAHGVANFMQFNFLSERGAIIKNEQGYYTVDDAKFFPAVDELAKLVLELQATGDYNAATALINKYGSETAELRKDFDKAKDVPADLNSTYMY